MRARLFPILIALAALAVSASAAFYSVFGLSKLFAGASTQVIIMAGSLEFAKLVTASLLYQYWETINRWLRTYLSIAVAVLMIITSGGIYGYLSGAFEQTNTQSEFLDKQVKIIDAKRLRFIESRDDYKLRVRELTTALANPTMIQYVDKETGQLVTTTSSRVRKIKNSELSEAKIRLDAATDSIALYDVKILEQEIGNESARELGPLKYMAKLTGKPMESIVNWFMLLIIFVFDPLAVSLIVAANMAFTQIKRKEPEVFEIPGRDFDGQVKMSKPEGLEFNTPYTLEDINPEVKVTEETEKYDTNRDGILDSKELLMKEVDDKIMEKLKEHKLINLNRY